MFSYYNASNWLYYTYKNNWKILEEIKNLNKSHWDSIEQITDYQEKEFHDILKYAKERSSYYNTLLASVSLTTEKNKIPILTKNILRENLENISVGNTDLILNQTGGSTGIPLKFYNNKEFINIYKPAANTWAYNMGGYRLGDNIAVVWGFDKEIPNRNLKQKLLNKFVHKSYEINSFSLSGQLIKQFCEHINKHKRIFVKGYANSLYEIAKYILSNKISFSDNIKGVFSEAEFLNEEKRAAIEKAFNSKVFNYYGSREFGTIAVECEEHNGLHINYKQLYVEITEEGKILITSFMNLATPFIRYEIGDSANKIIFEKCKCGRSSPRIDTLSGRESDNFISEANKIIHGEYVTHLFYNTESIFQFQIIQNSFRDFTANIISRDERKTISEMVPVQKSIENQFGYKINLKINFLSSIPKTRTGKLRFTIRNF